MHIHISLSLPRTFSLSVSSFLSNVHFLYLFPLFSLAYIYKCCLSLSLSLIPLSAILPDLHLNFFNLFFDLCHLSLTFLYLWLYLCRISLCMTYQPLIEREMLFLVKHRAQRLSLFHGCQVKFPSLDNYDPALAWPLILDNFVEWIQHQR